VIQLPALKSSHAAKLFLGLTKNLLESKYHNYRVLERHPIFGLIEMQPKYIIDLAKRYELERSRRLMSLNQFEESLREELSLRRNEKDKELGIFRRNIGDLREQNPSAYRLLSVLSHFPAGLGYLELLLLSAGEGAELLPSDWPGSLLSLCRSPEQPETYNLSKIHKQVLETPLGDYYYLTVVFEHQRKCFKATNIVQTYFNGCQDFAEEETLVLLRLAFVFRLIPVYREERLQGDEALLLHSQFTRSGLWALCPQEEMFHRHFAFFKGGNILDEPPALRPEALL
jgi:hypothetical protein